MKVKFKGKRKDVNKWHYGSYVVIRGRDCDWTGKLIGKEKEIHYIVSEDGLNYAVHKDSVMQCIDIEDIKGVPIYDGDIVTMQSSGSMIKGVIVNDKGNYVVRSISSHHNIGISTIRIIGNKIDNTELYSELVNNSNKGCDF